MSIRSITREQYLAAVADLAKHAGIPAEDIFETRCHVSHFTVRAYDRREGRYGADVIERTVYIGESGRG